MTLLTVLDMCYCPKMTNNASFSHSLLTIYQNESIIKSRIGYIAILLSKIKVYILIKKDIHVVLEG